MIERPILFSGPMVRAILAGRKTQTRRVLARSNSTVSGSGVRAAFWGQLRLDETATKDGTPTGMGRGAGLGCGEYLHVAHPDDETVHRVRCRTEPGDRLWVKETFAKILNEDCGGCVEDPDAPTPCRHTKVEYRADGVEPYWDPEGWSPSIFMPRWASRLLLEVQEVLVQRVREITHEDARAEGRSMVVAHEDGYFPETWDAINGKRPGCAWAENPWVWAITFRRLP